MAALVILATGCNTDTKDSYSTMSFYEYSLVIDRLNPDEKAEVSSTVYNVKLNWTQNGAELSTSDLSISNQKKSFETELMPFMMGTLVQEGTTNAMDYGTFSSTSNVGIGATITNLNAGFGYTSYFYNGVYVPGFETATTSNMRMRLVMGYDLNDHYHVQTFWPECFYVGTSNATKDGATFSTQVPIYRVQIDFSNKVPTAKCVIYNPTLTENDTNMPRAIVIEGIVVNFTNTDYYLTIDHTPELKVLNDKNVLVDAREYSDTIGEPFWLSNFNLYLTSTDLTRASISYELMGHKVNFSGASSIQVTMGSGI